MGCAGSTPKVDGTPPVLLDASPPCFLLALFLSSAQVLGSEMNCSQELQLARKNSKKLKKPKPWKHTQEITPAQLTQMCDEFWDTAPHYGGQKEIWDALRAAAEADLPLAQTIVDSAGIIVSNSDMTLCYDERGAKYELPKYVLSEPTNLIRDG
ncbi:hypothetical protein ABZP36_030206 [Zizania latifolia]